MEFSGIYSSQNLDQELKNNDLKIAYCATSEDGLMVCCGHKLVEGTIKICIYVIGIALQNTDSYETYEVFRFENLIADNHQHMKQIAKDFADKVIYYNKQICSYYAKTQYGIVPPTNSIG